MPARRLQTRKIREVLRLKHEQGLCHQAVAAACGVGVGTVNRYLQRAAHCGFVWPLPAELDDAAVDATGAPGGAAYPVTRRIEIPSHGIDLEVTAAVDAQELETGQSTGVTYWEGAIDVRDTRDGAPVSGSGYLEMTGYAGAPMSTVLR